MSTASVSPALGGILTCTGGSLVPAGGSATPIEGVSGSTSGRVVSCAGGSAAPVGGVAGFEFLMESTDDSGSTSGGAVWVAAGLHSTCDI